MKLSQLLDGIDILGSSGNLDVEITGIAYNSKEVKPGYLFICITGFSTDGHLYIPDALAKGAVAVVGEKEDVHDVSVYVRIENSRKAISKIANNFYSNPSSKLQMVGITGTKGKTTTTYLVEAIFKTNGDKTGLMGTVVNKIGDEVREAKRTTPEALDLQALLAEMVDKDVNSVVMEVSSHAVELGRVAGCEYDIAVLTNITQDHFDFHKTFENYREAKTKFFDVLGNDAQKNDKKFAIINLDDPSSEYIAARTKVEKLFYSVKKETDFYAKEVAMRANGVTFTAVTPAGEIELNLRLTGIFNIYNVLAAVAVGYAAGIPLQTIKSALEDIKGVPGRFELVDEGQDFTVIVDYAHTADSLENILCTAKGFAKGKIIVVFGCGGDRDRTKRPIMGRIAAEFGDFCIITSDNPRTEEPKGIIKEVEAGLLEVEKIKGHYLAIEDRAEAIRKAIEMAVKDDVVIIAGKGHETYQILKDRTVSFDDRDVSKEFIRRKIHGTHNS